ncbi:hypothetical protein [Nocardioides acrostichi]|uniref:Uncharacterized protein n=1 Tax=Nocardioides acrostichi TaxID=2784339 RepID=A0A930YC90_9ACTN|nr:hypothetical protein [Nocardioides acrostichi]MBF4161244.1 hypothetical protein [Nocardioides acrostichi]
MPITRRQALDLTRRVLAMTQQKSLEIADGVWSESRDAFTSPERHAADVELFRGAARRGVGGRDRPPGQLHDRVYFGRNEPLLHHFASAWQQALLDGDAEVTIPAQG